MCRESSEGVSSDSGVSTVEVVILTPLIVLVMLTLVCFGLLVSGRDSIQSAARDAARMASLQTDLNSAGTEAAVVAQADLTGDCTGVTTAQSAGWIAPAGAGPNAPFAGGTYQVTVTCTVPGLLVNETMSATAVAPVDTYRGAQ